MLQQANSSKDESERDIAKQIGELELRYERIQTENHRIKSEREEAQRLCEQLREEVNNKEEQRRQTQWQLDDERTVKSVADDTLQRNLRQAALDLTACKESAAREVGELTKTIAKINTDLAREKDFRSHLEQHVEELKLVFEHDKRSLGLEMHEHRVHQNLQQIELEALREERDNALNRAASIRLELEAVEAKGKNAAKECDLVKSELKSERGRIAELEDRMKRDKEIHLAELEDVRAEKSRHQQIVSDQILDNRSRTHDETSRMTAKHQADLAACRQLHVHDLQRLSTELTSKVAESEARVAQVTQEVDVTKQLLVEARRQNDSLQVDRNAVQVRLDIKENELERLVQHLADLKDGHRFGSSEQQEENMSVLSESGVMEMHFANHHDRSQDGSPLGRSDFNRHEPPSPTFSTDMGAVSIPNSPDFKPSAARNRQSSAVSPMGRYKLTETPVTSTRGGSSISELQQRCDGLSFQLEQEQQRGRKLEEKNDKLANQVKEMSLEMRELVNSNTSYVQGDDSPTLRQVASLQQRITELSEKNKLQHREIESLEEGNAQYLQLNQTQHSKIKDLQRQLAKLSGHTPSRHDGNREEPESRSVFNDEWCHPQSEWGRDASARSNYSADTMPSHSQPPLLVNQQQHQQHHHNSPIKTPLASDYYSQPPPPPPVQRYNQSSQNQQTPSNPWQLPPAVPLQRTGESAAQRERPTRDDRPQSAVSRVFSTPVVSTKPVTLKEEETGGAFGERKAGDPSDDLAMLGRSVAHSQSSSGFTNRGVSVFHNKSVTPIPISNSDRTTDSQLKALNLIKSSRRASTNSIPPARRNYAKGDDVDAV
eukprot:gene25482-31948_t